VPTVHAMAPATQPCSGMAVGESDNVPHPKTRPDATGLHRLPKTDKMEVIPDGQNENDRRKLPNNNRPHPSVDIDTTMLLCELDETSTTPHTVLFIVSLKLTK